MEGLIQREPRDCEACSEKGSFYQAWTCEHCPEFALEELSAETWALLLLRRLKLAGFPFQSNDLDFEQWLLLGALEEKLVSLRKR